MAKFHFHLAYLSAPQLSHRTSVEEAEDGEVESEGECGGDLISSPLIAPAVEERGGYGREGRGQQFSVMAAVAGALRKSLVMCSFGAGKEGAGASMEISWPTNVQHIAHVTFDRFDGFLGLPLEFLPDVPSKVPSASISVFGVSAESMQCSHDNRGNSVPTILLSMQKHLYSQGGLKAEGIFRINAENGREILVREQLNQGMVPCGVDLHCLAGLIKAWFRELPSGVLDPLSPEQVMRCNTEEDCRQLARMLPLTEAALLNWSINLMADVVEHEQYNKMNARNIAMVFAPNMTQMADPLTALIHAVQVMNFLKTMIVQTLRERQNVAAAEAGRLNSDESPHFSKVAENSHVDDDGDELFDVEDRSYSDVDDSFRSIGKISEVEDGEFSSTKDGCKFNGDSEGLITRFNIRRVAY